MQRIHTEIENVHISQVASKLFNVQSHGQVYQVWLGSEDQLPSCQCMDYRIRKLPCKHICAVVQQPSVGWESLGSRFNAHPLFILDQEVTQSQPEDTKLPAEVADCPATPLSSTIPESETVEENSTAKSRKATVSLPCRKKSNIRRQCIQEVKSLHDELYLITDRAVLNETLTKIREALKYARNHRPKESGIALKDKTLSPKKKIAVKVKRTKLARRKKKDYFKKRVGSVADARNAKISIGDKENGKRKISVPNEARFSNKRRRELLEQEDDTWVIINGLKLTNRMKNVLLTKFEWLSDDHIDAAQYLIKQLGTGVSSLNCIAATTHCSRFAVPHDFHQTIQCHNIGSHWVVSSSVSGKLVVYESLYTTVNESLKRQLTYLYKGLCNDDGSLDITVVLQQWQKGSSDCGLFCIANGVALANGIDPTTVSWDQDKMRDHLYKCFEKQKIEMFPHEVKQTPARKCHYVVSVYCICLKHIPGAPMVYWGKCDNWFHHVYPTKCVKLTVKQAAALATESPFVCEYCEKDSLKKTSKMSPIVL